MTGEMCWSVENTVCSIVRVLYEPSMLIDSELTCKRALVCSLHLLLLSTCRAIMIA